MEGNSKGSQKDRCVEMQLQEINLQKSLRECFFFSATCSYLEQPKHIFRNKIPMEKINILFISKET